MRVRCLPPRLLLRRRLPRLGSRRHELLLEGLLQAAHHLRRSLRLLGCRVLLRRQVRDLLLLVSERLLGKLLVKRGDPTLDLCFDPFVGFFLEARILRRQRGAGHLQPLGPVLELLRRSQVFNELLDLQLLQLDGLVARVHLDL